MNKNKVVRLIIEDQEDVIYWDEDVTMDVLHQLAIYVTEEIRKKYKADDLVYKNFNGDQITLKDTVDKGIVPVFVSTPSHPEIITEHKDDPRKFKNLYIFTNKDLINIQRFEGIRRREEIQYTSENIKQSNETTAKIKYYAKVNTPKLNINGVSTEQHHEEKKEASKSATTKTTHSNRGSLSSNGGESARMKNLEGHNQERPKVGKNMVGHGASPAGFMAATKDDKPKDGKVELKDYTIDEIKKHNTVNDAWMVLNGKVYNVTKYLMFHPGGTVINKGIGKDGTQLFNQYHSWVNANHILEKYHIGFYKKNTLM